MKLMDYHFMRQPSKQRFVSIVIQSFAWMPNFSYTKVTVVFLDRLNIAPWIGLFPIADMGKLFVMRYIKL